LHHIPIESGSEKKSKAGPGLAKEKEEAPEGETEVFASQDLLSPLQGSLLCYFLPGVRFEAVSKLAFPKIVEPADLECGSLLPPSKTAHLLRAQDFTKKAQSRLMRKLCLRALQRLRPPIQNSTISGKFIRFETTALPTPGYFLFAAPRLNLGSADFLPSGRA
jgi:hypothetical protein